MAVLGRDLKIQAELGCRMEAAQDFHVAQNKSFQSLNRFE